MKKTPPEPNKLKKGDIFKMPISHAHPTQCSVGMLAVECKKREIEAAFAEEEGKGLYKLLCKAKHLVPVVIGPGGVPYLTDHHHLSTAIWRADIPTDEKMVNAYVLNVWSDLDQDAFWAKMIENNLTWLYDDKGEGPINPALIPDSIGKVLNDPFRTLSKWVRDCGCYRKNPADEHHKHMCEEESYFPESRDEAFFIEFRWANFLRQNIRLENGKGTTLSNASMPYSPKFLKHEVSVLEKAFAEVVKLIGCHKLKETTFDKHGCPIYKDPSEVK